MIKRAHVVISGRVQGVWYRASTKEIAEKLGVVGWVRNTRDGDVEAVFEGTEAILERMIKWCHQGPSLAKVSHVAVDFQEATGEFHGFSIRY